MLEVHKKEITCIIYRLIPPGAHVAVFQPRFLEPHGGDKKIIVTCCEVFSSFHGMAQQLGNGKEACYHCEGSFYLMTASPHTNNSNYRFPHRCYDAVALLLLHCVILGTSVTCLSFPCYEKETYCSRYFVMPSSLPFYQLVEMIQK